MNPRWKIAKLRSMKNMNKGNVQENKEILTENDYGNYFEILIKGQLDASWSDWLEGLELKLMDNGEMMLYGYIRDQAELMGILNKLYRLNLALLSVREINQRK